MLEIELVDQRNNPKEEGLDGLFQAVGEQVLSQQGVDMDASVSVSLVEEEEIQRINREFRGVDRVTDVLSFPMLAGKLKELQDHDLVGNFDPETGCLFLGDLVLCPARIVEQAQEYGHSQRREYGYMLAHGLLHLLGYDHETDEERREMRELEEAALQTVHLSREE